MLEANGVGSPIMSDVALCETGRNEVEVTVESKSELSVSLERVDICRDGDGVRQLSEAEKGVMRRLREVYYSGRNDSIPSLKSRDQRRVRKEVELVNGLIHNLACEFGSVTDVNRAEWAGAFVVCESLGLMGCKDKKEDKG